jgi:hypothetical protein
MSLAMHLIVQFEHNSPEPKVVKAVVQQALTDHYGPFAPTIDAYEIVPIKERT